MRIETQHLVLAKVLRTLCSEKDFYDKNLWELCQRVIYLAQVCGGINLGYCFKYGYNGPVSEGLGVHLATYLKQKEEIDTEIEKLSLKRDIVEGIERVRELIKPIKDAEGVKYIWLNMLSLIHFLDSGSLNKLFPQSTKHKIKKQIIRLGPSDGYAFLDEAWKKLEEFFVNK